MSWCNDEIEIDDDDDDDEDWEIIAALLSTILLEDDDKEVRLVLHGDESSGVFLGVLFRLLLLRVEGMMSLSIVSNGETSLTTNNITCEFEIEHFKTTFSNETQVITIELTYQVGEW